MTRAVTDLEKYVDLEPDKKQSTYYRSYLGSLKYFAQYYERKENDHISPDPSKPDADPNITSLKVLAKRRASYTDEARRSNVSGTVTLLVYFCSDGSIKGVLLVKSLGYGLDEQAINAARAIKFDPQKRNGIPEDTVRPVMYSFNIY